MPVKLCALDCPPQGTNKNIMGSKLKNKTKTRDTITLQKLLPFGNSMLLHAFLFVCRVIDSREVGAAQYRDFITASRRAVSTRHSIRQDKIKKPTRILGQMRIRFDWL